MSSTPLRCQLAHDLNNLLTIIIGHCAVVAGDPATPPAVADVCA